MSDPAESLLNRRNLIAWTGGAIFGFLGGQLSYVGEKLIDEKFEDKHRIDVAINPGPSPYEFASQMSWAVLVRLDEDSGSADTPSTPIAESPVGVATPVPGENETPWQGSSWSEISSIMIQITNSGSFTEENIEAVVDFDVDFSSYDRFQSSDSSERDFEANPFSFSVSASNESLSDSVVIVPGLSFPNSVPQEWRITIPKLVAGSYVTFFYSFMGLVLSASISGDSDSQEIEAFWRGSSEPAF
jgi:hypothetical protein